MGKCIAPCDRDNLKYRKKSRRKSPKKANHKHEFQPCVFEYEGVEFNSIHGIIPTSEHQFSMGGYCRICGKIGDTSHQWTRLVNVKPDSCAVRVEDTEEAKRELNPETRTLPTFFLERRWFQKYVNIK